MLPTTPLPLNVVTSNVMYVYSCSQCEFKTHIESLFKQHVDSVHLGIPNVPSNAVLGQNTAIQTVTQSPLVTVSASPQTFTSGQIIASASAGTVLSQAQHVDKLHKCPKCNLVLPSKNQLTQHKRKVHGKTATLAPTGTGGAIYTVVSTNNTSSSSSSVVASLVSQPVSVLAAAAAAAAAAQQAQQVSAHTAPAPSIVASSTNLTGKKTYSCTACGYSTTRRDGLSQHYDSVHLKIKNHQCELCPYAASQKGTLNRHVKLRHKKNIKVESSVLSS